MELTGWGTIVMLGSIVIGIIVWVCLACGAIELLNKINYYYGDEHEGGINFISFIICLVIWLFYAVNFLHAGETTMVKDFEYNIYAIEDNRGVSGGRYYIETTKTYDYLADYKDGKKQYSVNKDNSYVVEDKTARPHIEVYVAKPIKETNYTKFMFRPLDREYKIVVPERTLTTNFNVDLK